MTQRVYIISNIAGFTPGSVVDHEDRLDKHIEAGNARLVPQVDAPAEGAKPLGDLPAEDELPLDDDDVEYAPVARGFFGRGREEGAED